MNDHDHGDHATLAPTRCRDLMPARTTNPLVSRGLANLAGGLLKENECLAIDSENALTYYNRGVALFDRKEYDTAFKDFEEAIRLDPEYASAYRYRSKIWSVWGLGGKARKDYDKAIRLDPVDPDWPVVRVRCSEIRREIKPRTPGGGGIAASADKRTENKNIEDLKRLILSKLEVRLDFTRVKDPHSDELRKDVRRLIERTYDLERPPLNRMERDQPRRSLQEGLLRLAKNPPPLNMEREQVIDEVLSNVFQQLLGGTLGFGPLDELLRDPMTTDILINGPRNIFVERHGMLKRTETKFGNRDTAPLLWIIDRIVSWVGHPLTEESPSLLRAAESEATAVEPKQI